MTDMAKLVVSLEAESAKLRKDLEKANKQLEGFGKRADKTAESVKTAFTRAGAALAGFISVAAIKNAVDTTADFASEVSNLSTRLGGTVEEWSRLAYAAEQTDVGFSTAAMAAQRMTRRIAEAAHGSGEAVGALNELGLSAKKLQELTPSQQLSVLGDALQGVEKKSDKVRIAMKLFDSEGVKLLQMLDGGSAGLRQMAEESDRLGTTITREGVDKMHAYEMAMKEAKSATEGVSNQLAIALGPTLAEVSHWMADVMPGAARAAGNALADFGASVKVTAEWFAAYQAGQISFTEWLAADNEEAAAKLKELKQEMGFLSDELGNVGNSVGEFSVEAGKVIPTLDDLAGSNEKVAASAAKVKKVYDDMTGPASAWLDMQSRAKALYEQTRTPAEEYVRAVNELNSLLASGQLPGGQETFNRALEQAGKAYADSVKKLDDGARDVDSTWKGLGLTFSSAFEDAIVNGEKMSDVLAGLEQDILRIMSRKVITEPLTGLFSGIGDAAGDWLSGMFKASGGPVAVNSPYIVGEQGPELFIPNANGTVIPNHALGGGGSTVLVNINEAPGTKASVQTSEQNGQMRLDVIIEQVDAALGRRVTTGVGGLNRAMQTTYGLNPAAGAHR